MQQLDQYGRYAVEPLTEEEQSAVNGGDGVTDNIFRGAGAVVGSIWWLMKAGGSALDLEYMHL